MSKGLVRQVGTYIYGYGSNVFASAFLAARLRKCSRPIYDVVYMCTYARYANQRNFPLSVMLSLTNLGQQQ